MILNYFYLTKKFNIILFINQKYYKTDFLMLLSKKKIFIYSNN